PHASGGLALGTYGTSAALLAILIAGIAYTHHQHRREPSSAELEPVLNEEPRAADTARSRTTH
ncbi:hypothetical protein ACFYXQ_46810, partial [Nocardia jiangxiensis]